MKPFKKVVIYVLLFIGCAVLISLPFGIKIIQEEGWEGVWSRKRSTITKVIPESAPIVDEAERITKKAGLQK